MIKQIIALWMALAVSLLFFVPLVDGSMVYGTALDRKVSLTGDPGAIPEYGVYANVSVPTLLNNASYTNLSVEFENVDSLDHYVLIDVGIWDNVSWKGHDTGTLFIEAGNSTSVEVSWIPDELSSTEDGIITVYFHVDYEGIVDSAEVNTTILYGSNYTLQYGIELFSTFLPVMVVLSIFGVIIAIVMKIRG